MWWKPPSSRRSDAGAAASSRSKNTAPIAPRRRATWRNALGQADALFLADDGDSVVGVADALAAAGAKLKNIQLLGTGLWDNPRVFASPNLQGGLYAAPDPSGFRSFSTRYRAKYSAEPVRTATLAYDAVALVAALARTQGGQRFAPEVLTNTFGLCRDRRPVSFPPRRHQRARPRRDARRPDRQPAGRGFAEELWGVRRSIVVPANAGTHHPKCFVDNQERRLATLRT